MSANPRSCEEIQGLLVAQTPLSPSQHEHARACPDCGFFAMLSKSRMAGAGVAPSAAAPLATPVLAGLEIRDRLGGGAFGTVFKAWQPSLQRYVAVKWIPLRDGLAEVGRMREEGIALGQLRHPHVLAVFDSGVVEGAYYLVTELAESSLRNRPDAVDPRDLASCARFFGQVLSGLEAAHAAGIVHRDVKPENILLQTVDGALIPKLADFGLSRGIAGAKSEEGLTGTPAYAAPELWRGEPATAHSDLFAAGVVFFELLTGRHPFEARDALSLRRRIESEPRPSIRALAPGVSEPLARVVEGLLAKDPARRPGSAREAAAAIAEVAARRQRRIVRAGATAIVVLVAVVAAFIVRLDHERRVSEKQLERILQLSDVKRLDDLRREADLLWPARGENVPALERWVARAKELEARLPVHRARLAGVWDPVPESEWQRITLENLVRDLEAFLEPPPVASRLMEGNTLPEVERRLAFARVVERESVLAHAAAWDAAIAAVRADRRFDGFTLVPQVGLVPLGSDPRSGLQEFADLQTGTPPVRGEDGGLVLREDSSVVFVLVPGGTFCMGADASTDPDARENEGPAHEARIEPFLLSKYEMTQGQWLRVHGHNPSQLAPATPFHEPVDLRHPVERVSWNDSTRVLARLGFALPTEPQWEWAVRAGTTTSWWTGAAASTLGGRPAAANVADAFAAAQRPVPGRAKKDHEKGYDDGWSGHAPVGSFRANAFGLHEMTGNVWEWIRDPYRPRYDDEPPPESAAPQRVVRGGGWRGILDETRSAYRDPQSPTSQLVALGVRPIRPFDGER